MRSVPPRIDPGAPLGAFVVERRLARGARGDLYQARSADGGPVVIRLVAPDAAPAAVRARLLREARALAAVDHAGLVRVLALGDHEGHAWIAMDPMQGTELAQLLAERGPVPSVLATKYVTQAADALAAAHDAGVIHRDLGPDAVMLRTDGHVVVGEVGFASQRPDARALDRDAGDRDGVAVSPYLSPEQIELGLADERSDVWALGCLLYELAVGSPPFGKGGESTTASILNEEPTFPGHLSSSVRHVVSACLRKSSFARVASPRELLVLLRETLELARDEGHGASPSGMPRPIPPPPRPASSGPTPSRPVSNGPGPRDSRRPSAPPTTSASPSSRPPPMTSARPSTLPPSSRPPPMTSARPSTLPPSSTPPSGPLISTSTRGRIKGTAVRAVVVWFAGAYGGTAMARVAQLASIELRSLLRPSDPGSGIMASAWYDTILVGELLDTLERVAPSSDAAEFGDRVGEAIARDNVSGVYRALFRLIATPALMEANAQRVWATYVDEGTLDVKLSGPRAFSARVRGWSRHHPTVCRVIVPSMEHVLRAVGYKSVSVARTRCVARGDGVCEFEARLDPPV